MKRPMVYILIFFILGIILERYLNSGIGIIICIGISYLISYLIYKKYKLIFIMLFPIIFTFGIINYKYNYTLDKDFNIFIKNKNAVEITGVISSIDKTSFGKNKIILKADSFKSDNITKTKKIKVQAFLDEEIDIDIGWKIKIEGNLYQPKKLRNPGGFNEELYLKTRKVFFKVYPKDISIISKDFSINTMFDKLRNRISSIYENVLPKNEAGILKAMILGDKSDLDEEIKMLYSDAGIYHIMAISGLHLSIICAIFALIIDKLFHKNFKAKSTAKIGIIIFLIMYCIFTGCNASTVRATIMISIVLIGYIITRTPDFLTSISTACLLILIYQPLYLFDIGFQYSFAAVYSIAIFSNHISNILSFKNLNKTISSVIAVNIGSKPITAFYFYKLTVFDIITNILVIPLVFIIVLFGIITGISGFISINLAKFCAGIIYIIFKWYEAICRLVNIIPFSVIKTGHINIITILLYFLIFYLIYLIISKKSNIKDIKIPILLSIITFSFSILLTMKSNKLEVAMLDVGQGDCIVASYNQKCFIIDGGGKINNESYDSSEGTGTYNLLPYLTYKWINNIDYIFISHFDYDHVKGILEILDKIKIEKILVSGDFTGNIYYDKLISESDKNNIPVEIIKNSEKIYLNKDIILNCIYPYEELSGEGKNNDSLVLKLIYKNVSFLFTGDIEEETEIKIIEKNSNIKADILKLAHHGSNTSTTDKFLDLVSPNAAIVSTGVNNSYLHPSPETIDKLEKKKIPVFNTAESGAVILKTDGNKIFIKTMLDVN